MLKRELVKIIILGLTGLLTATVIYMKNLTDYKSVFAIMPLYVIGTVYAGSVLFGLLGKVLNTVLSCQCMSLVVNPLWGSIMCLLMLVVGVVVVASFGWIIGIFKCIHSMYVAYQLDCQCMDI